MSTDPNLESDHTPDSEPDMAEDFGLDAEPGSKGKHAFGAGLSGDIQGNTVGANDPDTYHDAPSSGAKTGGGGV